MAGAAPGARQLAHDVQVLPALGLFGHVAMRGEAGQQDDALHTLLVYLTTVRAYRHANGARKKTGRKP